MNRGDWVESKLRVVRNLVTIQEEGYFRGACLCCTVSGLLEGRMIYANL